MKKLLVTFEVLLPDEATNDDADAIVMWMTKLAVAPDIVEANGTFPMRPVGKLSDWMFEGHD